MWRKIVSIFITLNIYAVTATHFRGGLIYWQMMDRNSSVNVKVQITQRFAWRRSSDWCDDETIQNKVLTAYEGDIYCAVGCSYWLGSVDVYCTDYSVQDDWIVGERTYDVLLPLTSVVEASFARGNWISTLVFGANGAWELRIKFFLDTIFSNRVSNASPLTKMSPIINILYGCNHTIEIPVIDPDGDVVRCRWAEKSLGECADICRAFPGALLNEIDCKLSYNAVNRVGLYAVAIQIEDFPSIFSQQPFSSVPLQFLVNVYDPQSENETCYAKKPIFIWPTRQNGACIGISLNSTFNEIFTAKSGSLTLGISDISTQSPIGLTKSALIQGTNPQIASVNITWMPLITQVGNSIFCFTAIDTAGTSSDQNCITLSVGTIPPQIVSTSISPVLIILPNNSDWSIGFSLPFKKPHLSAFIRFHNESGAEIFKIDTATNINVRFLINNESNILSFATNYKFSEKRTFYITVDNGIVIGLEQCNPESVGVLYDQYFWRFVVRDVTPPMLQFISNQYLSNGSIEIRWTYDERAGSICLLQQSSSAFYQVVCNTSVTLTDLSENYYTLFVQATDEDGNTKQYQTSWYVDLTPPAMQLNSLTETQTNKLRSDFTFYCIENTFVQCLYRCAVTAASDTPSYSSCSSPYSYSVSTDGDYTFHVFAIDAVGNVGPEATFSWSVDTIMPTITNIPSNLTLICGTDYSPSKTGFPTYYDNADLSPKAEYSDVVIPNCQIKRVWTVYDRAQNRVSAMQVLTFISSTPPTISAAKDLYVPCGELENLFSQEYAKQVLNVVSQCKRQISITYIDDGLQKKCGVTFYRQWSVSDDCGSTTAFIQIVHISYPVEPDLPANGQTNVNINQVLGWPSNYESIGYNIYIWRYGSKEPISPVAYMAYTSRRYYSPISFPPNTQILWRIGYIAPYENGTIEIPGPMWGFQTQSFVDLQLLNINIPQTAFSGMTFIVTWSVQNIGNVSTSLFSSNFYDAIYLSRTTNFEDAVLKKMVIQERYIDPYYDSYTSSDVMSLAADDFGQFFVFVVTDVYNWLVDYSAKNNRLLASHSVFVQLTPPPNLQVTSVTVIGLVSSGQSARITYIIQNTGIGITAKTRWTDAIYLSRFDKYNSSAMLLYTATQSGSLLPSAQRINSVDVPIPNAVYDDYYIIVYADMFNDIYENTNEDDNTFSEKVVIILSPYPDLTVLNINCSQLFYTNEQLNIWSTIENIGTSPPFEYAWSDIATITSLNNGIVYFHSESRTLIGQRMSPSLSYINSFSTRITPAMLSGNYNLTIITDAFNEVFEYVHKDNNAKFVIFTVIQQLPDLTVSVDSLALLRNDNGNNLYYNCTIKNIGRDLNFVPTTWQNLVYILSPTGKKYVIESVTINRNDLFAKHRTFGFYNSSVPINSQLTPGVYTVGMVIDSLNQILEESDLNNDIVLGAVNIPYLVADLAVVDVFLLKTLYSGTPVSVSWTVQNQGNLSMQSKISWYDDITLSFGGRSIAAISAVLITLDLPLLPQKAYNWQANISIPKGFFGKYDVIVTTGRFLSTSQIVESNKNNNAMPVAVSIFAPQSSDLVPKSCTSEFSFLSTTRILTVFCVASNEGNSMLAALEWTDHFAIINNLGREIISVDKIISRQLLAGETYASSISIIVPSDISGNYQLRFQLDLYNNVDEIGGESNNILLDYRSVNIPAKPSAAFSIFITQLSETDILGGSTVSINYTVTNVGLADLVTSSWTDGLFLYQKPNISKNELLEIGIRIGDIVQIRSLTVKSNYSAIIEGNLPYLVNKEMFLYIVTDINNKLLLSSATNAQSINYITLRILEAPLPDLSVTIADRNISLVQSGISYPITFVVLNNANVSSRGIWYDTVYLSQDAQLDPFDIALKSVQNPLQLSSWSNYSQNVIVSIPFDLPQQNYYFIMTTNIKRQIREISYDNNMLYQPVTVQVLPAVDLAILGIRASKENVSYGDKVSFDWSIANNGSIHVYGYKCDSVYLSSDNEWDVSDVTIIEPLCNSFSLNAKSFINFSSIAQIQPVSAGLYKSIVRTRSNLKDFNLKNNIGTSEESMLITPPTIALNEIKNVELITNQGITFMIIKVPSGMGIVITLNTTYQFAYHNMFIKKNAPPKSNDYDIVSERAGTVAQRVSIISMQAGVYYLLIESYSAEQLVSYLITVSVRETKFEITSVYPPVIATSYSATLALGGNLFGTSMHAFLSNSTFQIPALSVLRYISEEAYVTFDTRLLDSGVYTVSLYDNVTKESCELANSITVNSFALPGRLNFAIISPRNLRISTNGTIQLRITNSGFSDVQMSAVVLRTDGNSTVLSIDAEAGVLSSENIVFFPTIKNKPSSLITPQSTRMFSFTVIPNLGMAVGFDTLRVNLIDDATLLSVVENLSSIIKPSSVDDQLWQIITNNIKQCLNINSLQLLSTISGLFNQHYNSFYSVLDVVSHLADIVSGEVPPLILAQSIDLFDSTYAGLIKLELLREYKQYLISRRTSGPFGKGWTSQILEISAELNEQNVILTKQRRQYIFRKASGTDIFINGNLSEDYIIVNMTVIIYRTVKKIYYFSLNNKRLLQFTDANGLEVVQIEYDPKGRIISLVHSNGRKLSFVYNSENLINYAILAAQFQSYKEVSFLYNSENLLTDVLTDNYHIQYSYNKDGDLLSISDDGLWTNRITYDNLFLVNSTSVYLNNHILETVAIQNYCNGKFDVTAYSKNVSSSYTFGLSGKLIKYVPTLGLSVSNILKQSNDKIDMETVIDGDQTFQSTQIDRKSNTEIQKGVNGNILSIRLNNNDQLSIFNEMGLHHNVTFVNNTLTQVDYKDKTHITLTYTNRNQLATVTRQDGSFINYYYDNNQQVIGKETSEGRFGYSYTTDGLLTRIVSPDGLITEIKYNDWGLPISVLYSNGIVLSYTYNECRLRKSVSSNTGYNCTYIYDSSCNLITVLDANEQVIADFAYNERSQLVKKTFSNGMSTTYTYDQLFSRLQRLDNFAANGTLLTYYVYSYDRSGYRVQTETKEGIWRFKYDAGGQLTEWTSPNGNYWEKYEYDMSSNRKSKETGHGKILYTVDSLYRYLTFGDIQNFTYDPNGNVIEKTTAKDQIRTREQYKFNHEGRILKLVNNLMSCDYNYDVFGSLTSKSCSDGSVISYVTDPFGTFGSNIISMKFGQKSQFVYHATFYGLLSIANQINPTDRLFYLFDGDGSTALIGDMYGNILGNYIYSPFGDNLTNPSEQDYNSFRYLGQFGIETMNEANSKIILMRNRLYDIEHGRFFSPDPLTDMYCSNNPYNYANNNPFTYKDPHGLYWIPVVAGTAIGSFYGGAIAAYNYLDSNSEISLKQLTVEILGGAVNGAVSGAAFSMSLVLPTKTLGLTMSFVGGFAGSQMGAFFTKAFDTSTDNPNSVGNINLGDSVKNGIYNMFPTRFFLWKEKYMILPLKRYLLPSNNLAAFSVWSTLGASSALSILDPIKRICNLMHCNKLKELTNEIITWVVSKDPNEIYGPAGYGDGNFLSANHVLEYKIAFENDPNATAPAQRVQISCPLDSGLDLATFRIGTFAFGNFKLELGYRSNIFSSQSVKLSNYEETFVRLQTISPTPKNNNTAFWIFQTLSANGLRPFDPSIGFLPPNNGTNGQGFVTFQIGIKKNIAHNTVIYANASIFFDENPPITTGTVKNTIDSNPPTNLNLTGPQNPSGCVPGGVVLHLNADDSGSGIKAYNIYSVDSQKSELTAVATDVTSNEILASFVSDSATNSASAVSNTIQLASNQNHLVAVAIDNVNNIAIASEQNTYEINNNVCACSINCSTSICPQMCNNKGNCTSNGCLCNANYRGVACEIYFTNVCEPPILEFYRQENFTESASIQVYLSAVVVSSAVNISNLVVVLTCSPTISAMNKGRLQPDGAWHLSQNDFGIVSLNPPPAYYGFLNLTAQAILTSQCGITSRTVDLSISLAYSGETTSRALMDTITIISLVPRASYATMSSRVISNMTSMITSAVPKFASDSEPIFSSTPSEVSLEGKWGEWSNWSACSGSCGYGIQVRQRNCSISQICRGNSSEIKDCCLNFCSGLVLIIKLCN